MNGLVALLGPLLFELFAHRYVPWLISRLAFVDVGTFPLLQRPTERQSLEGYRAIHKSHHWPGGPLGGPIELFSERARVWVDASGEHATVVGPLGSDLSSASWGTTLRLDVLLRDGERVVRARALPMPLVLVVGVVVLSSTVASTVVSALAGGAPFGAIVATWGLVAAAVWFASRRLTAAGRASTLKSAQRLLYAHFVTIALREAEAGDRAA